MNSTRIIRLPRHRRPRKRQDGLVLVVGLLILLVLTILGISAMRGTTLEERMAGNMQDKLVALQAAEAALRAGEADLTQGSLPVFGSGPYYNANPSPSSPLWQQIYGPDTGSTPNGTVVKYTANIGNAKASYFIEHLNEILSGCPLNNASGCARAYRVTAEGVGLSDGTAVVLQSTFIR